MFDSMIIFGFMINTFKYFILSILFTILIFSCGKENQSSNQGGKFYVKATISPPLQLGKNMFQIAFVDIINLKQWNGITGSKPCSELSSFEADVTGGQEIKVEIICQNNEDYLCRTVTLQGILNGNVIKTYSLSMGNDKTNSNFCPDGEEIQKTFTIQ